jgi:hypothetical protein
MTDRSAPLLPAPQSTPVIELCCPHCGGTLWRQEKIERGYGCYEQEPLIRLACDSCAVRREAKSK